MCEEKSRMLIDKWTSSFVTQSTSQARGSKENKRQKKNKKKKIQKGVMRVSFVLSS